MNPSKQCLIMFLPLFTSNGIFASKPHSVTGRYLTVTNQPLPEQQDLLSQILQVRFPVEVQTVGDAMHYLLRYSGYSLIHETDQSAALKNTLKKPLPLIDRNFGPMSLKDALITLVGPAFTLVQDPLNREVNFTLKPNITWKKG